MPSLQRAVAPFPAALEPPEELEPLLPEDPPDEVLPDPPDEVPPDPLTVAALAVTVTFTLTVFVAVTVGAGFAFAVSVAVAVVVTVGAGCALVAAVFVVLSSWLLPPAPTPMMKARPMAGSMYRLRPHFGLGGCGAGAAGGQCPGGGGGWLYDMVPPRRFVVG
ncbi:hypothetical protein [Streptomyces sp. NPDC048643]|uniref:hypothetical protein n=1 Tax=Streptomyces sp. NPDC048643 TaxID=3155637 RepID=UPI00344AFCD3